MEAAVPRESRFQVDGHQQVQHRVEHQHEHNVRDAHLVVRRHGDGDVIPRQPGPDALEHDQTLEYVAERGVRQHGRRQYFPVGHGRVLGLEDHERRVRTEPQHAANGRRGVRYNPYVILLLLYIKQQRRRREISTQFITHTHTHTLPLSRSNRPKV